MKIQPNRSHLIVLVILAILVIWMLSGEGHVEDTTERPLVKEAAAFTVGATTLTPEKKTHAVRISAHVAANRAIDVIAEVSGKVTQLDAQKGTSVKKGDLLLRIDERDLPERLKQAEAQLKRRQIETESTKNLYRRDLTNQSAVVLAEADLAEAEAVLTSIKLDLAATRIRAPFSGIYDQRHVEDGEYVTPGTPLVRVIDTQTMLIKGVVSEKDIHRVRAGLAAYAELPNGTRVDGKVRFVAASAHADTRTYDIEMEVTGDRSGLYDGQTATLFIPQGEVDAYEISPALLVITDTGGLGIKVLKDDNTVDLLAVDILEAGTDGIWIQGPQGDIRLITIGQGFVKVGEIVRVADTEAAGS